MKASFKAFMREIVDYAGLFPPADLSLDTSLQKYNKYRKSKDAWMLSRYIIPAGRLGELKPYGKTLFAEADPFSFSILGKRTETVSDYKEHIKDIVAALEQFYADHGDRVKTDVLEIKLPREAVFANDDDLLADIYEETILNFKDVAEFPNDIFFEGIFDKNWEKEIGLILESMNRYNESSVSEDGIKAGFKLRCGGVEADMFPSIEQVAFTLQKVCEQNLALKCTAGLHHPIRHYDHSIKTKMHGFINVFGGAMLGYAHDFSTDQMAEVLKEEDTEHFSFTDSGFRWKDYEVSTEDIEELREVALISFGSCSFNEPREDLRKLELL
ncbi:hypothetical protein CK503_03025 [Aliifodinibius salipaludis]|uniref:Uncharacterized protein n=1 Tax=Fodinibius salipaludis TaxID=2032627 RepID=A0A2A2GBV4_9BACT|nr:hypothetical protein [Aliifodinibius salipaludis]PAU95186.1 hypothetical protein CK503_03025 [Aliifodinibius salipaludis]